MLRKLSMRFILSGAVVVGSAALAAGAVPGGIAGASPLTVTCSGLAGVPGAWSFSGCAGTAFGLTGATGTTVPINPTKLKITWVTTKTSKVLYSTTTAPPSSACPIVSGLTAVGILKETGKVVGGNATLMIGGLYQLKACEYSNSTGIISAYALLGNVKA